MLFLCLWVASASAIAIIAILHLLSLIKKLEDKCDRLDGQILLVAPQAENAARLAREAMEQAQNISWNQGRINGRLTRLTRDQTKPAREKAHRKPPKFHPNTTD